MHNSSCQVCPANKKGTSYFIELSLIDQLKTLYSRENFYDQLQSKLSRVKENDNNYEDIYDGSIYKKYSEPGKPLSNPDNISFTWNSDGISIFSSSNYQIWPFMLSINELPFNQRMKRENLLVGGLWLGPEKPLPSLFLHHISLELNVIKRGIDLVVPWMDEPLHVQGHVICGTCDLPAKAIFLNMQQYNGENGCQKCEITIERQDNIPIYNYQESLTLRSQEMTDRYAEQAQILRRSRARREQALQPHELHVKGVKGPSPISLFQRQYIRTTAIDVMHCVYLGVVKLLIKLWFSPKYSREKWSFSRHLPVVDRMIRELTPPDFITRLPRTIFEHIKFWKAHEFKAWFFYYSLPVLQRIMTAENEGLEYFVHYRLLVNGMSLLSKSSISEEMINLSEQMFNDFVKQFPQLYDKKFMTANLHLLLHLPSNTRDFGPTFVTSCFTFENMNGELTSLVTGTRFSGLQISTGLSFYMALPRLINSVNDESIILNFCRRLTSVKRKYKGHRLSQSLYAIGAVSKNREIPENVRNLLNMSDIRGTNIKLFFRLMKATILYRSTMYSRQTQTNSNYVKYMLNHQIAFGNVYCFVQVSNCLCTSFCDDLCRAQYYAIIKKCNTSPKFDVQNGLNSRIFECTQTDDTIVLEIRNLTCVCFFVKIAQDNVSYIVEPINLMEIE